MYVIIEVIYLFLMKRWVEEEGRELGETDT